MPRLLVSWCSTDPLYVFIDSVQRDILPDILTDILPDTLAETPIETPSDFTSEAAKYNRT